MKEFHRDFFNKQFSHNSKETQTKKKKAKQKYLEDFQLHSSLFKIFLLLAMIRKIRMIKCSF